jgi:hypothetical protein
VTSVSAPARSQLAPLLGLRLVMVRSGLLRGLLLALLLLPVLLSLVGVFLVDLVPDEQSFNVALGTPTIYVAFILLAVMAPLAAGGGYELYPPEQLVAYPIRPRTVFMGTLLLAPVNLAWMLNVVALILITSFASGPVGWGTVRGSLSVAAFVALATAGGHALAWFVVGVRQTRTGRRLTWATAVLLGLTVALLVRLGYTFTLLDSSPTKYALVNSLQGYNALYRGWLVGLVVMVVGTAVLTWAGIRSTAWALRRPGDHAVGDGTRPVRRRGSTTGLLGELIAVDRASIWRSIPLRRGVLVLLILPGAVAAMAGLSWQSLVLLPGLVAAGAALLFGVNAFCLDASGATWLATQPGWAKPAFVAKTWAVTEVSLLAVTAAVAGGAVRAPMPASGADVTATVAASATACALVVASSMRASVRHPYRADLRGPRDTPAPPGVMALHSLRLAVLTTTVGLIFSGFAFLRVWWLPLVLAVPFVAWAGLSLIETSRVWAQPSVRARVVTTVSGG